MTASLPSSTPSEAPIQSGFLNRVWRAMLLEPRLFEEVETDTKAGWQALLVVIVAGAARGASFEEGLQGWIGAVAFGLAVWVLAAALLSSLGRIWLRARTNWGEMLRALGFAAAPLAFLAPLGWLPPPVRPPSEFVVHGWSGLAVVLATREAFDVSTSRAVVACVLGLGAAFAVLALLGHGA